MKKFIGIIIAMLLIATTAYAREFSNVETIVGEGYVSISGNYDSEGVTVGIAVLSEPLDVLEESGNNLYFIDDTKVENGYFEFRIPSSAFAGKRIYYTLSSEEIDKNCTEYIYSDNFLVVSASIIDGYKNHVNEMNEEDLYNSLEDSDNYELYVSAGYLIDEYKKFSETEKKKIIKTTKAGVPYDDGVKAFNREITVQIVNSAENKNEIKKIYSSSKNLLDEESDNLFTELQKVSGEELFYEDVLKNKPYASFEKYNLFIKKSMTRIIEEANDKMIIESLKDITYKTAIERLEEVQEWLGFSIKDKTSKMTSKQKDKFLTELVKVTGENKEEYVLSIKNLIKKYQRSDGSGSSGGSGGGSSSGSKPKIPGASVSVPKENDFEFPDMKDYLWAQEAVNYLCKNKIVNGDSSGNFNPANTLLREEAAKMIVNAFKIQGASNNKFEDVDLRAWYGPYVSAGKESGIIQGVSEKVFGIGSNIKRCDFAVMIYRGVNGKKGFSADFKDKDEIPGYAVEAVGFLKEKGVINGIEMDGDLYFCPHQYITRAEAAKILYEVLK